MLEDRQVRTGFSRRIEEEAARGDRAGARRSTWIGATCGISPTFTVDPASAHDFDDAVSASRTDRGVRLWVHIADVAAHVRPGDALEKEALPAGELHLRPRHASRRCCPTSLSSDACSLAPERERLAVTSEIELSEAGEPLSASFYRSLIRSDARLDYDQLDEIFAGRAKPPRADRGAARARQGGRGGSRRARAARPPWRWRASSPSSASRTAR